MSKVVVGRAGDPDLEALPREGSVVRVAVLAVADVDFIGLDPPEHEWVNLCAPEPHPGQSEGWLYFKPFAAYTSDLAAIRKPH